MSHQNVEIVQGLYEALNRVGRLASVSPSTRETPPSPWRSERLACRSTGECTSSNSAVCETVMRTLAFAQLRAREFVPRRDRPRALARRAVRCRRSLTPACATGKLASLATRSSISPKSRTKLRSSAWIPSKRHAFPRAI